MQRMILLSTICFVVIIILQHLWYKSQLNIQHHKSNSLATSETFFNLEPYHSRMRSNHRLSTMKTCNRILVGFFTTMRPDDVANQNERRKFTKFHNIHKPLNCGINYVFVVGNNTANEKKYLNDDTVMVPITDNVNHGKSYTWFKDAFERFQDADYVFKVDSDVQICTPFLEYTMQKAIYNNQNYFGKMLDHELCGRAEHCPSEEGNSWYYMSGGFYGMSMSLISQILESGYAEKNHIGHEDVWVGRWVYAAAPETIPYSFDCLSTHRHCPAYHWNVRKNYTRYDESLCEVLMMGQPLPWAQFAYH